MLVIESRAPAERSRQREAWSCPSRVRCKSRLRTRLESGEEAGLFLERGTVLRGGDKLLANDGRVVEVVAAPEALLEVRSGDALLLAQRRLSPGQPACGGAAEARAAALWPPTTCSAELVRGLGLKVHEIEAPFEPEGGAYGVASRPRPQRRRRRSWAAHPRSLSGQMSRRMQPDSACCISPARRCRWAPTPIRRAWNGPWRRAR